MTWQPIETAPLDENILLWGKYWSDEQGLMNTPLVGRWSGHRWEAYARYSFGIRPTHWMPLPEPPT